MDTGNGDSIGHFQTLGHRYRYGITSDTIWTRDTTRIWAHISQKYKRFHSSKHPNPLILHRIVLNYIYVKNIKQILRFKININ